MTPTPGDGLDLQVLVERAVAKGQPNVVPKQDGCDPVSLFVAVVINERYDLADKLIAAGVIVTDDDLERIFWWFVGSDAVAFFVKHHIPLNDGCLLGPLRHDHWEVVFALLDTGMNVQAPIPIPSKSDTERNNKTTTLLHVAAWAGEPGATQTLLKRGAVVDAFDDEDVTPLMKVCESQVGSRAKVVYWLLEHGANPNAQTPEGETPLLLCLKEPETNKFVRPYRNHRVQVLLNYGADPNALSPVGTTALMLAARDNDAPLVRSLLNAGADRAVQTPDGKTALDVALKWKSDAVAKVLREG